MSSYLKIVEKCRPKEVDEQAKATTYSATPNVPEARDPATKATEATKAPGRTAIRKKLPRDQSDISDKRVSSFTPLTVREVLAEINRPHSGPALNAATFYAGLYKKEISAVEQIAKAILYRRGRSIEGWQRHAPAVRAALTHGIACECEDCAA